jgi:exo-1,4-beta-D-glucosaminidase
MELPRRFAGVSRRQPHARSDEGDLWRPANFEDYERKAQAMAYDSERAMFEAYSRNKYESTGVIQWMLNNAWPSMIWHLYDYYLQPAGGYFGAKKACEPLHVMYAYNDRSVEVINSRYEGVTGVTVVAEVYDAELRRTFSNKQRVDVSADGVTQAMTLPESALSAESPIHFVRLKLQDANGWEISNNFYWISTKKTVYDWSKTTYRYTPMLTYEDFNALQALERAENIDATATLENSEEGPAVRVKISNHGDHLAFQLHLGIARRDEDAEILPVLWEDNYFALLPGESREVHAQFLSPDALNAGTELRIDGWNVASQKILLQAAVESGKR